MMIESVAWARRDSAAPTEAAGAVAEPAPIIGPLQADSGSAGHGDTLAQLPPASFGPQPPLADRGAAPAPGSLAELPLAPSLQALSTAALTGPGPSAPSSPTASSAERQALELVLADPLNREVIAAYGGPLPTPAIRPPQGRWSTATAKTSPHACSSWRQRRNRSGSTICTP